MKHRRVPLGGEVESDLFLEMEQAKCSARLARPGRKDILDLHSVNMTRMDNGCDPAAA